MMHLIAVLDAARAARLDQRLREEGLSIPKHRALGWARLSPGCSMSELSRGTFVDRTTLTRVIDQLAAAGHVVRDSAPGDRRKVLIHVTPAGEAQLRVGDAIIREINGPIAGRLEPDAVRQLNRSLLALIEALIPDAEIRAILTGATQEPPPRRAAGA